MTHLQSSSTIPIDIGSRLELMVDEYLIARLSGGAELRLNKPIPREAALVMDKPWEGNACGYTTIFQDGDIYRMYYTALQYEMTETTLDQPSGVICYAESDDGIHWEKYRGAEPVMDIGLPGSLDAIQADGMSILRIDDQFVMWYAGYAGVDHGAHRLGIATSPDGMHWTKGYRSNRGQPLAGLAGKQQLGPSVYFDGENYLMLYNTHWQGGWATFLATSRDGVHWGGGSGDQRILPESPAGNFDTAGRGRNYSGSPSRLIPVGDRFRVWYGAEDGSPPHSVCIGLMETEEF